MSGSLPVTAALQSLVPFPRSVVQHEGGAAAHAFGFRFEGGDEEVAPARRRLASLPADPVRGLPAFFRVTPHGPGAQAYRLRITESQVVAEASDRSGLFYAAVTFAQLVRGSAGCLPVCEIEDAPDFPARGVMLDISRDKVPTLATLFELADLLAELKLNQLQLYTEHTFAYRGHEEVWRDASPMTPEEVRALDVYCRERCIDLVPNQNSFGHLERWLTLTRYNGLAELPQGGAPLPWGGVHEKPTSLCPTDPRSEAFLADLYDQLLPNFSSRLFNVGCDETFDLRGAGRSAESVRRLGEGRVYLDFLKKIHALVHARGRTPAFWGDIIIRHPELVPEIPAGSLALEWGYEADHPFDAHGALFAASGVPFYVCPGTSSWNSLAGRTANMLQNMRSAAMNGLKYGACGYLITDWGDGGHWQPLAVSYAGYVYGAALSWGYRHSENMDLAAAMDALATAGHAQALLDLGHAYQSCGALRGNGTELFMILSKPRSRSLAAGVTAESLQAVSDAVGRIADSVGPRPDVVAQETVQAARLLQAACSRGIALATGEIDRASVRRRLASEMDGVMAAHADVWRLRNREGGLADSLARMQTIRAEYGA